MASVHHTKKYKKARRARKRKIRKIKRTLTKLQKKQFAIRMAKFRRLAKKRKQKK